MDYLIIYNKEPIGQIIEPKADESMGVVVGPFIPFPAYEQVRSLFRLFVDASGRNIAQADQEKLKRFYQERDLLGLSIKTVSGLPVKTLWINIVDVSADLGEEGYEAEFCVDYVDGTFFSNAALWDEEGKHQPD